MRYGFFPGCAYKNEAGYSESADAVNRALGIELVEIPDWNCCGATAIFSLNEIKALAIIGRIFALADKQGFGRIVTPCNACYTTLRKAKDIFEASPETLVRTNRRLSAEKMKIENLPSVTHYLEVLYNDVEKDVWSRNGADDFSNIKIGAYYGCQLTRPWGDLDHPERPTMLDRFIKRIGFLPIEHSAKTLCCGASHLFPYESDCLRLIARIIGEIQRKGGEWITTLCPMCQFNLDAMQSKINLPSVPVPYFSQLAGLALGLAPSELGIKKLIVPIEKALRV